MAHKLHGYPKLDASSRKITAAHPTCPRSQPHLPLPAEQQHPVHEPEDVGPGLVNGEQHCDAPPAAGEGGQDVHHARRVGAVQTGGGLVQEEQAGPGEQLAADGDATLLTTWEGV